MFDINDPMAQEYIVEAKEHLNSFEDNLLLLDANNSEGLINKLFRSIHTVKGGSGFFGFAKIGELSHSLETVLDMMRSGDLNPEKSIIDIFLRANDLLKVMFDNIEDSNSVDVSESIAELDNYIKEKPSFENTASVNSVCSHYAELIKSESEAGSFLYYISFENESDLILGKSEGESVGTIFEIEDQHKESPYSLMVSSVLEPEIFISTFKVCHLKLFQMLEPVKQKSAAPVIKTESGKSEKQNSVRINLNLLDELMRQAGELVIIRNQFMMSHDKTDTTMRGISHRLNSLTASLQESIMKTRMQPVGGIFRRFNRIVRDLGHQLHKEIELATYGDEVELDKTIIESLADPLTHLIRNSCDHGIETPEIRMAAGKNSTGVLALRAWHEAGKVYISIEDDGQGINLERVVEKALEKGLISESEVATMDKDELAMLVTLPGFSTAAAVSDISGRGVGMDVVKSTIEKIGGMLTIHNDQGKGCKFVLELPLTLAIIPALIVECEAQRYVIPQVNVEELLCLYAEDGDYIEQANSQEFYRLRNELLPIVRLNETLSTGKPLDKKHKDELIEKYHGTESTILPKTMVVVIKSGLKKYGLVVDEIISSEEIVVNPLHSRLNNLKCVTGATVMGNGSVSLILDAEGISQFNQINFTFADTGQQLEKVKAATNEINVFCFKYFKNNLALPVQEITRIVRIKSEDFQEIANSYFITVDNKLLKVINPAEILNLRKRKFKDEMYLILPRSCDSQFGVLATSLGDTVNISKITKSNINAAQGTFLIKETANILINIKKLEEIGMASEKSNFYSLTAEEIGA